MMSLIFRKPSGTSNKTALCGVLLLILCCVYAPGKAHGQIKAKTQTNKEAQQTQEPPSKASADKPQEPLADSSKTAGETQAIDWGEWESDTLSTAGDKDFGVGIQGKIEAELSRIDKSNLLRNASGVAAKEKATNSAAHKKTKDMRKTMAELEAMEAKVKKEIEDDSEF